MRFIITLLCIYLIWQVVKFLFRIAFRYWLMKNGGKAFFYSSRFGPDAYGYEKRKEGEIRVENSQNSRQKTDKKSSQNLGEYVDFEEVK